MAQIKVRRDSAADWTAENPTLAEGELGFETDTGKLKIGNGVDVWTALDYFAGSGVADHGGLTGLGDDDHTQYLDETRHAAVDAADHGSGAAIDGQVLTADGAGGAAWENPSGGGASELGDLSDVDTTGAAEGQVLKLNASGDWVPANDDVGSGSLPTATTKGDLAVFDGSQWVRVGVGADGQVLTADAAETAGVKWVAGGGGGVSYEFAADIPPVSSTEFDDEFDGGSLDIGLWTEYKPDAVTTSWSVDEGDSQLYGSLAASGGDKIYTLLQDLPGAGDWDFAFKCTSATSVRTNFVRSPMIVLAASDETAQAACIQVSQYDDTLRYEKYANFASRSSTSTPIGWRAAGPTYLRVAKAGTTYSWFISRDGSNWLQPVEDSSLGFTPTRVGFGLGTMNATWPSYATFEWFRKIG